MKVKSFIVASIIFSSFVLLVLVDKLYLSKKDLLGMVKLESTENTVVEKETVEFLEILASNLEVPWAITFLPDNTMLVTERSGKVRQIGVDSKQNTPIATLDVKQIGEGGLLGIAAHPNFVENHFVYFYYTYSGNEESTLNKVTRMVFEHESLREEMTIVDKIEGAANHNGGRIKFGPDNYLYITTGDAQEPSLAQDITSLAGKILRVGDDGRVPDDNPFGNLVYSYGHRNPQGISWDENGNLWATEHGRSGVLSGRDEINRIEKGVNYGWPEIQGDEKRTGMVSPYIHSGDFTTWAPAGIAIKNGILYFGGLRGQALYKVDTKKNVVEIEELYKDQFGRIREVIFGPDNYVYITTSNKDGRGDPDDTDDKLIRININSL
ncbi:PQQ-dependent sugar dehydrogenase [Candidatus Woesebacteria bacterium]|nr:MAG: PQQ-dependent sugar dehydrogenase [Candidatus Woesebacteria bacterium]